MIFLFLVTFYTYSSKIIEDRASESMHQLSVYISSQLDGMIENMDRISLAVVFSESINDNFSKEIPDNNEFQGLLRQRDLSKSLYSILGTWIPPVRQINIFNQAGFFVGTGNSAITTNVTFSKINSIEWVKKTIDLKGYKYLTLPRKEEWKNTGTVVFSLTRVFGSSLNVNNGTSIVEVQQDYSILSDIIKRALGKTKSDKKVIVFDKNGDIMFPLNSESSHTRMKSYWQEVNKTKRGTDTALVFDKISKSREILTYNYSDYTNFTVLLVDSEKKLLSPVIDFRNAILLVGIVLLFITLFISYFVAKQVTTPIKQIHKSIKALSLENLSPSNSEGLNSGLNELEELNMAFSKTCARLKNSLEEVVSSKSYEIQAKMLALQSKMNPHFLYNTITTIYAMAEQENNAKIMEVCQDLSKMLRYILSESSAPVTIKKETSYALSYLELMTKRYKDFLHYSVEIPDEMETIMLPKMILQPLVENSTKYGINVAPPWHISIRGTVIGDKWYLSVEDNGPGFGPDKIRSLKENFASINIDEALKDTNFEGIGLENIYRRLKLSYGEAAVFEISDNHKRSTIVTIGGTCTLERDKDEK